MGRGLGPQGVLPIVSTVALFLAVVFGTDAIASRTWADLLGLVFLMASPFVYSRLKALVPAGLEWASFARPAKRITDAVAD